MVYEAATHFGLGPIWSALLAGFAVWIWGELHVTPLGEFYLACVERTK